MDQRWETFHVKAGGHPDTLLKDLEIPRTYSSSSNSLEQALPFPFPQFLITTHSIESNFCAIPLLKSTKFIATFSKWRFSPFLEPLPPSLV